MAAIDSSKPIKAVRLVRKPELIKELQGPYIMLHERNGRANYSNMLKAFALLHDAGWQLISTAVDDRLMIATLKRVEA